MNDSSNLSSAVPCACLGVHGLPNLTNQMLAGGLYAFVAGTPPARYPVLATSLSRAIGDGLHCNIVVPSHPELFVERIESFGQLDLQALLRSGNVNVFEMEDEFPKKMFRFGADSFVQELEYHGIPEQSYIVFDQADELLALHDVSLALDQVDVLRKWFEQKNITALLVFSRTTAAHSATINALMDSFTGLIRLGADKSGLELTFDYWQSPEGTIAARNFHLRRNEAGFYEASSKTPATPNDTGNEDAGAVPVDDSHYFYMDPDLGSLAQQLPGVWQRVDTLVGMMHATRGKTASTIILSFYRDTRLRHLAEAVHTLRLTLGKYVRIVVQEKGASLRYQNEALLLRLGVNLVIHRDVTASRLPLLLESLRGQVFSRDVNINFEVALASVLPSRARGYLVPPRFVKEVELVLDRAENLNIPCALIVGKPKNGRQIADIITAASISRAGDLISADNENCFLFLNACPQTVLLTTLQRILGAAVEDVLEEVRFLVSRDDVSPELAALTRAIERSELPDYSALVPVPAEQEESNTMPEERTTSAPDILPPPVDTTNKRHVVQQSAIAAVAAGQSPIPVAMPAASPSIGMRGQPAPAPAAFAAAGENAISSSGIAAPVNIPQYAYNATPNEGTFGKRAVPRAVRSIAAGELLAQLKEDTVS
jgi:cellulose biosynthesis protein BcsE